VFEDSGGFPTNRAELYQNGVDVLLKRWDVKRNIERSQVYKGLSLKRKEALLGQIARKTFEAGNYFFKQCEAERYISEYIQNLPGASTDPEALEVDSAAVLKSIEAYHGLLVERARGIYSFSHLTFHEYFTAQEFATNSDPKMLEQKLQILTSYITDKRWREVFLLTIEKILPSADYLLQTMKYYIDRLIAEDKKIQHFLVWVKKKSESIKCPYKLAAIRSFYFYYGSEAGFGLSHSPARSINPLPTADRLTCSLDKNFEKANHNEDLLKYSLALDTVFAFANRADDIASFSIETISNCLTDVKNVATSKKLQELKRELLVSDSDGITKGDLIGLQIEWWRTKREVWTRQLRAAMIEHRNIGTDWEFSGEETQRLSQYYDANKLLVDCLNSDCDVSREVRQEIEETLLLPIAEIEKWKKDKRRT
jgi:predicted NACHT family NTPase